MTALFYLINEIALFAGALVFTVSQEKREGFATRLAVAAGIYAVFTALLNTWVFTVHITAGVAVRMLWYVLLALIIFYCWEVKWSFAFYHAMWSFMTWQLLYELWMFAVSFTGVTRETLTMYYAVSNIMVFVTGYVVAACTFARWMTNGIRKIGPRQLSSGLLIFFNFELIGLAQRRLNISAGDSRWELLYLVQLLLAVVMYLQSEVFRKSALRQELALINLLHKKDLERYQLAKENIALINQKCHDLKHQIRAIRDMDRDQLDRYIDDIEKSVNIYESIAKTGNEVLDTILTEKSLYCATHDITVSCVADGSQLGFMDSIDIYSLLGNAMDNAIEAVEQIPEKEKRVIDVLIYRQQQFLMINIINPLPKQLNITGEFPVTTKENKDYHGFGMQSMKYVVKKYDGFMNVRADDGLFRLEILLPL